ncbi:Phospholipase/Carboxylesterase family protein [Cryptosporidium felis]|nr:Phospholipase/Carboxylesterase family protein [Cryptosporidium felis]
MIKDGDGNGGMGLHFEPKGYTSVLIWLHGKGDNANSYVDLIQVAREFPNLKNTKIVLPSASVIPLKEFGIEDSAWFDMGKFGYGSFEDVDDMNNTVSRISELISREVEKGIDPRNISLGGFSQGAAVSFLVSMASEKYTLGSCIVVGGWLPLIEKGFALGKESTIKIDGLSFEVNSSAENVDFLVLHGEADPVVLFEWSEMTRDFVLENLKPKRFTYRSYPGVEPGCKLEISTQL